MRLRKSFSTNDLQLPQTGLILSCSACASHPLFFKLVSGLMQAFARCGMQWFFPFMPYGQAWRRRRRTFHQSLDSHAIAQYHPIQTSHIHRLVRNILDLPDKFSEHMKLYVSPTSSCALQTRTCRHQLHRRHVVASCVWNRTGQYLCEAVHHDRTIGRHPRRHYDPRKLYRGSYPESAAPPLLGPRHEFQGLCGGGEVRDEVYSDELARNVCSRKGECVWTAYPPTLWNIFPLLELHAWLGCFDHQPYFGKPRAGRW